MEVQGEREEGILIAKVKGRIDGANSREFEDAIQAIIGENDRVVILDFKALSYISSAGLRVILLTAKKLQKRSGKCAVCSLSDPINEVFQISGFSQIIPTYTSRSQALDAHRD